MTRKDLKTFFDKMPGDQLDDPIDFFKSNQNIRNYLAHNLTSSIISTPRFLIETIVEILEDKIFNNCLDPWANNGIFLSSLVYSGIVKKGKGICVHQAEYYIARKLSEQLDICWEQRDPFSWLNTTEELFDLIVCHPPWGLRTEKKIEDDHDYRSIRDTGEAILILKACRHLNQDGVGIFIVPKSFVHQEKTGKVYKNLHKFGLALEAYFEIPALTFRPNISIGGAIAIIRKSERIPIFTGLIQNDPEQRTKLIQNYKNRNASEDIQLGTFIDLEIFRGFEAFEIQDRINRISKEIRYPVHPLKELITSLNIVRTEEQEFQEFENSFFLPRFGINPAVSSIADFSLKPKDYIQLVIDPKKADSEYLVGLFNSSTGQILRAQGYSDSKLQIITETSITNMSVFLPSLSHQKLLADADRTARTVENDIKMIHDQIWSQPRKIRSLQPKLERLTREESFKEWLDTLPYPIASILWAYNIAGNDQKLRYERLLHFFEGTAAFLATIQLSAVENIPFFREKIIPGLIAHLNSLNTPITRPSFGTWTTIYCNMSKIIRRINDEKKKSKESNAIEEWIFDLFKTHDPDVISFLTSKNISSLFQEINSLRNRWTGHGGNVGSAEATNRHEILKKHLETIQKLFGSSWSRFQLIFPINMTYSGGKFHQTVQRASGTAIPFEQGDFDLEIPLEESRLYMVSLGEREALQLIPFIRLHSAPENVINACYFFNNIGPNGSRYISYQFNEQSEIEENFPDIAAALAELLPNSGNEQKNSQSGN